MGDYWWIAAVVFLGVVSLPYVVGPPLVYFAQRFNVPTEILPLDPREQPLPESVRGHFADSHTDLTKLGFELRGVLALPKLMPDVQAICACYKQPVTNDLACCSFIVASLGQMTLRYTEFIARFQDGTVVQTNNSPQIGAFRTSPNTHTLQFWDIQDLSRLYALHQFHRRKYELSPAVDRLDTEFGGNLVSYFSKAAIEEEFARQAAHWLLAPTSSGYRPTLWGAYALCLQELWPLNAIRKQRRQRAAQKFLQEFQQQGG